jgi:hypothetical protein
MILAAAAAPEAIPVNPNTAATIAMIRKIIVQRNIIVDLKIKKILSQSVCAKPCHSTIPLLVD